MNSKKSIATIQKAIIIGVALYVVLPDIFIGPIDDTAIALVAGIAETVLGFAKSRIAEPVHDKRLVESLHEELENY